MRQPNSMLLLALLGFAACQATNSSQSGQGSNNGNPFNTNTGPALVWSIPAVIPTSTCQTLTLRLQATDGTPLNDNNAHTVTFGGLGSAQVFAHMADCLAGTPASSSLTVQAGNNNATVYLFDSSAETLTLSASSANLATAQAMLVVNLMQVLGQRDANTVMQRHLFGHFAGVARAGDALVVTDTLNRRVLIWQEVPQDPSTEPDVAVGAANLDSVGNFSKPVSVWGNSNQLFVVDANAHRILVWNTFPTQSGQAPDFALGQPDAGCGPTALQGPTDVFSDGNRLLVADAGNHRVLIWNTLPTGAAQAPDTVLGQPDFSTCTAPNCTNVGPATLRAPRSVWSSDDTVYATDTCNRVLAWPAVVASGQDANFALGQNDLLTGSAHPAAANTLQAPRQVRGDAQHLLITDSNRVLVWNALPTRTGQPADFALGQPADGNNLTADVANNGGISGGAFNQPVGAVSDGQQLFVSDAQNHRLLVWESFPPTPLPADFAIGQPPGAQNTNTQAWGNTPISGSAFAPRAVLGTAGKLLVSDAFNGRVLVWNHLPVQSQLSADFALGAAAGASNLTAAGVPDDANSAAPPSSVGEITGLWSDGNRLLLLDGTYGRVLAYNTVPSSAGAQPDFVISQDDAAQASATTLHNPQGLASDGNQLFVADTDNNRVLVWNTFPATAASADFALGQPDNANNLTSNGNDRSATAMAAPRGICVADGRLYVGDTGNNRILVWNTLPTAPAAADVALGVADANNLTAAGGSSPTQTQFGAINALHSDGIRLFASDPLYQRVLIWDSLPTQPGQPADRVLGQADFTHDVQASPTATSLQRPAGLWYDGTRLWIADEGNDRVLVWPVERQSI